jgi:hypothetical protein
VSDTGVHSNIYQRVREYGQLVDDVLVEARCGASGTSNPSRKTLAELLIGLQVASPPNLQTAWLGMLIGGVDPTERREWARVGRSLLSDSLDAASIEALERLARKLEERRAESLAKMRGSRS